MAAIFLFSGANVMPTSTNNRKAIEKRLAAAEEAVTGYVDSLHLGLPVPAQLQQTLRAHLLLLLVYYVWNLQCSCSRTL